MNHYSRWTMPVLRIGMGLFLAAWGVDKLAATEGSIGIFSNFYGMDLGGAALQALGGTHLFLASIVITAASIVLVLNARDATLTLDRRLQRVDPSDL